MAIESFHLKGNHRDTFRLIPVNQTVTNPGEFIHVPTDPNGNAEFMAEPANYYVHCRPAYTSEFILLDSAAINLVQYLRVLNPEINSDGIIELSTLLTNLTVDFTAANNNLPWVTELEVLDIRVTSTAGGVPSAALAAVPELRLYRKPGGTGASEFVTSIPFLEGYCSNASYTNENDCDHNGEVWTQLYDLANPHIYTYQYSFGRTTEDIYYFRGFAVSENLWSPQYPDVSTFYLDYTPPMLNSSGIILSSSSSELGSPGITQTSSVFISIPETSITDTSSGPELYHMQPFLGSKDYPGGTTGAEYKAGTTYHFEDVNLITTDASDATWGLNPSTYLTLGITDDAGDEILFYNWGDLDHTGNHSTLIINTTATHTQFNLSTLNSGVFTEGGYYNYKLFRWGFEDICVGDPSLDQTNCPQGGICSDLQYTNQVICEDNDETWTANYWRTGQSAAKQWPITFPTTGNLIQNLLISKKFLFYI